VAKLSEKSKDIIRNKINKSHTEKGNPITLFWIYYFVAGNQSFLQSIERHLKHKGRKGRFEVPSPLEHKKMYQAVADFVHELCAAGEESEG
jgi:hypothetical protein